MAKVVTKALILGHSFVKRFRLWFRSGLRFRAASDFNHLGTASVYLYGVSGRTMQTLQENDLREVRDLAPDIIILEIGANDLTHTPPEIVGSNIEDFVRLLQGKFSVRAIGVCSVIPRGISVPHALSFVPNASV